MAEGGGSYIPAHNVFEMDGGVVFSSNFDNGRSCMRAQPIKVWRATPHSPLYACACMYEYACEYANMRACVYKGSCK